MDLKARAETGDESLLTPCLLVVHDETYPPNLGHDLFEDYGNG